jgi:hypothetical protein
MPQLLLHGEVSDLLILEVFGRIVKESALRARAVQVVPLGGVFRLQVVHPDNAVVDIHFCLLLWSPNWLHLEDGMSTHDLPPFDLLK